MKTFAAAIAAVIGTLFLLAGPAEARCPDRIGVVRGDTLSSIAAACGLNVRQLRRANTLIPGQTLRAGTFLTIPRVRPTPRLQYGGTIDVAPPLVNNPRRGGVGTHVPSPRIPRAPRPLVTPDFDKQPGHFSPLPHAPNLP